ncbi:hypothetical protein PPGU19_001080 [Paraburkholderia sp. PGU19]|nr:hypothetical protein PPGU19_001080 [Paraburkholderia sp. PGU19]
MTTGGALRGCVWAIVPCAINVVPNTAATRLVFHMKKESPESLRFAKACGIRAFFLRPPTILRFIGITVF